MEENNQRNRNQTIPREIFLKEEIKSLKILTIGYLVFIFFAIAGFSVAQIQNVQIMEYWQFGIMVASNLFSVVFALFSIRYKKIVHLVKFILLGLMAGVITLGMYWVGSMWIFLGYYLLLVMASFFYDWKLPIWIGSICLLLFFALIFWAKIFQIREYIVWLVYFFPTVIAITLVAYKNHFFIIEIFQKQKEVEKSKETLEETKNILEIKVQARTKELQDLFEEEEKLVQEKTKELQIRIDELERFRDLAVGRELKMIELKKELEGLKKTKKSQK